mgnify:CR=1 FL=1
MVELYLKLTVGFMFEDGIDFKFEIIDAWIFDEKYSAQNIKTKLEIL